MLIYSPLMHSVCFPSSPSCAPMLLQVEMFSKQLADIKAATQRDESVLGTPEMELAMFRSRTATARPSSRTQFSQSLIGEPGTAATGADSTAGARRKSGSFNRAMSFNNSSMVSPLFNSREASGSGASVSQLSISNRSARRPSVRARNSSGADADSRPAADYAAAK